ncbi:MAG: RagB/SusD family nutrient uptake outer membrane protein [Prevotellaceae bacterium]|jgi:hypothetical protein|nr:RagB/SusD family nutrient uptake outer membrane protein [Prevotellaceae bacterium]
MKLINNFYKLAISLLLFSTIACEGYLSESPRASLTPDYYKTPNGIKAAVVSVYSGLRTQFCRQFSMPMTIYGTDEFRSTGFVRSANVSIDAFDAYGNNLNADNTSITIPWSLCFIYINTCNGVIERASSANMSETDSVQALGEAHFLRGFLLFYMTETFGGIPLDMGAGELKHNDFNPTTISVRNSVAECFAAIINDFQTAATLLPAKPAAGRVGKAAAKHFLSKSYLARAGDASAQQANDYDMAYQTAKELIDNGADYNAVLLSNYADVVKQGNEHSTEILFTIEHTTDLTYNEGGVGIGGSTAGENESKENRANFLFTPMYENRCLRARLDPADGGFINELFDYTKYPVPRNVEYQRPWGTFVPTDWLLYQAFADKINDCRFENSFRTLWRAGLPVTHKVAKYSNLLDSITISVAVGDTAFYVILEDTVSAAYRDSKNYRIFTPSDMVYETKQETSTGSNVWQYTGDFASNWWPPLTKYDDVTRPNPSYSSLRPVPMAKLSETYLIAAQAALRSGKGVAVVRTYLKALRDRATVGAKETNQTTAIAAMDAVLDVALAGSNDDILNFILDEQSRELCGEQWRWIDLKISGKLIERAKAHNENVRNNNTISEKHLLRPIPAQQMQMMTGDNKATYQNPGY